MKQMIEEMTKINNNPKIKNDDDRLKRIGDMMHQIASKRRDSEWSQSNFFKIKGHGRDDLVQQIYNKITEEGFSLSKQTCLDELAILVGHKKLSVEVDKDAPTAGTAAQSST